MAEIQTKTLLQPDRRKDLEKLDLILGYGQNSLASTRSSTSGGYIARESSIHYFLVKVLFIDFQLFLGWHSRNTLAKG